MPSSRSLIIPRSDKIEKGRILREIGIEGALWRIIKEEGVRFGRKISRFFPQFFGFVPIFPFFFQNSVKFFQMIDNAFGACYNKNQTMAFVFRRVA